MATMAEETRDRIEDLATQQAYQQGRRDADVDARLLGHERRLNAINGSIERHAKAVEGLGKKFDAFVAAQGTEHAVETDRERSKRQWRTRLQWSAGFLALTVIPILAAFIAAGKIF